MRGGADEAEFLLLRAQSLPGGQSDRRAACIAAVVELARQKRDSGLVEKAVEALHKFAPGLSLTPEQAAEVVRREKLERTFPKAGSRSPDYSDLLEDELCQCPKCRRARGENVGPFEDEDDELGDNFPDELDIPPGMPPAVAKMLFEATARAVERGESLDELFSRLTGRRPRKRKKGRRH